jgi:membrane protein
LQTTKNLVGQMPFVGNLIFEFLPLIVLWLTFALVYQLMPNTKVRFSAALAGGIMAGSLWHLNNIFGFLYVSRFVTNSKIYGSLFLVPVFMAGLYFSWAILLFGAQVAYAFQNRAAYLQDKLAENVNQRGREFVALRLMTSLGRRFQHGLPPATSQQISHELEIPSRLVLQVLQTLIATRLVSEVAGAEAAYAPARPLGSINAHHILHAMRTGGGQELPLRDEPARGEVYGEFARIEEAERLAASSVTMLELVNRAEPRIEISAPTKPEK